MGIESAPPERHVAALEEASTADLVREAMDEAKELVRLEVELAKAELNEELARVERAAIGFVIAVGAVVIALCLLAVALVLALGGTAVVALAVAGGFVVVGGFGAWLGRRALPRSPLEKTRNRLTNDVNLLKERVA